jgi:ribosomal protein S12 methylthiotransferase accessory factor
MPRLRLPASESDNFSFWHTGDNHVVQLKPAYSVHELDQETIVLLGAQEHRIVRGDTLVAVLRELRSARTVVDLLNAVAEVRRGVVYKILYDLFDSGLINIWDSPIDVDASFELCLSTDHTAFKTRICVFPAGLLDNEHHLPLVCDALSAIGFTSVSDEVDYDTALVVTDTYLNPKFIELSRELICRKDIVLSKIFGDQLWVGPAFSCGSVERLTSFQDRIFSNHPTESRVIREFGVTAAGFNFTSSWSSHTGALLLARIMAEHLSPSADNPLKDYCITFDYRTLTKRYHSTRSLTLEAPSSPLDPGDRPAISHDGGKRIVNPKEFLARVDHLISPITGLVPDLIHDSPASGLYVCHTVQVEPNPLIHKMNRKFGSRFGAAGKGETAEQATASCIGEALERYSACYQGNEEEIRVSLTEAQGKNLIALDPRTLMLFSEKQYSQPEKWSESSFHYVPDKFDPDEPIGWLKGQRWHDGAPILAPAAFTLFNYNDMNPSKSQESCFADSNGCAVGSSIEEAILHGTYELIERDACAIWWYNRLSRPSYDLRTASNPYLVSAVDAYRQLNRDIVVLDLTSDIRIPVACAISWNREGKEIGVGLGCDLDAEVAVSRAICELNQFVGGIAQTKIVDGRSYQNEIVDWIKNATVESLPYLTPSPGDQTCFPLKQGGVAFIRTDLDQIVKLLKDVDLCMYYVNLSRPETSVCCARVMVPGLRHFWARFAPGRLYDVPVKLGWMSAPLKEDALNPTPFFL